MLACRHSPLSGSHDLENWGTAATESVVDAYRCVPMLALLMYACLSGGCLVMAPTGIC